MTDDTHDRDRAFSEIGNSPEATGDGRQSRPQSFGEAGRTPAGTADSARSTADRPAAADRDGAPRGESNPDPNGDRVEERLRAVERALTGTDDAVADLGDEASASAERAELSTRLDDLEARVEELEAATQAIRGYVGSIRSVNQAVERRADLALAKASEGGGGAGDEGTANAHAGNEPAHGEGVCDEAVPRGEPTDDDAIGTAVPSEADLDAAVPTDRRRESQPETAAEAAADRSETDREHAGGSWGSDALERLRDSL